MTHATSSGRPPWAVVAWSDDTAIYIELPCKDGPPYIERFPHTEGGLSKALYVMRSLYQKMGVERVGRAQKLDLTHPKVVQARPRGTDAQRESARAVLKKLNLI